MTRIDLNSAMNTFEKHSDLEELYSDIPEALENNYNFHLRLALNLNQNQFYPLLKINIVIPRRRNG